MAFHETLSTTHEQYRSRTPHARKADGVYYTPKNIVDSVVKNSLGKLIANKTQSEVATIKIVDPACGCGNFLVSVYQYLLNWYAQKKASPLTIPEKQSILKNNIFGVDIDSSAVEITRQSLSILCNENGTVPQPNIQVGNSLIDTDFNTNTNTFSWEKTFPNAIQSGGFDIVIGNPPWGQKAVKFTKEEREYLSKKYPASSVGIWDLFRFFVEKSIAILKPNGILAQVLPDIILLKNYETTRRLILDNTTISQIEHWGTPFKDVNLEVCSIVTTKNKYSIPTTEQSSTQIEIRIHNRDNTTSQNQVSQNIFNQLRGKKFNILLTDAKWQVIKKLSVNPTFGDYFKVHEGIHTGNVRKKLFVDSKLNENCKKIIIGGGEVQRNKLNWNGKWVHYTKEILTEGDYAGLGKHEYFEQRKLVIRRTGDYVLACLDEDGYYFSNNVFVCIPKNESIDLNFYLTILNSKLITWYYQTIHPQVGQLFPEIKINIIKEFPICEQPNESEIKTLLQQTDQAITNQLIYKLYNLTKEEIDIMF